MKTGVYRLVVIVVLLASPAIAAAQDDTCSRDAIVASFAEAAANGEMETWADTYADCPAPIKAGVRGLVEAYNMLGTEVAEIALDQMYTIPTGHTFHYPDGWVAALQGDNTLMLSSSRVEAQGDVFNTIPPGEVIVMVGWGTAEDFDPGAPIPPDPTPFELLDTAVSEEDDPDIQFETPYTLTLGAQEAAAVEGMFYQNEILFLVFKLEEKQFGFMLAAAAPGDLVAFVPTVKAITASAASSLPTQRPPLVATEAWRLAGAERLLEDIDIFSPALSPDGSIVAGWHPGADALCLHFLESAEATCTPAPEASIPSVQYLRWSPDGTQIAFTPEFFKFFHEPDLWIYHVETGTYTNLTPDGVDEFGFEGNPNMLLDVLPAWNPATEDLYFFRSQPLEAGYTLELYRAADPPELVRDLTQDLPEGLPVWQPPAISPDGTQMAFMVAATKADNPANGIWLLDLEKDTLEHILPYAGFARAGIPAWYDESYAPIPHEVAWVAGGDGLVFSAIDPNIAQLFGPGFYYIDMETRAVTPLVDLSDVPDQASFFESEGDTPSAVYRVPRWGVVSPDGGTLFYIHHEQNAENAHVSALPLPPDGSAPALLGEIEFIVGGGRGTPPYLTTAKENGRAMVLYHNLITVEETE